MRATVSNFVADWSQLIIQLIDNSTQQALYGANSIVLSQFGQSFDDECSLSELGDWFDIQNKPISNIQLKSSVKQAGIFISSLEI